MLILHKIIEGQAVCFFQTNLTNYSTYRGNTIYPNVVKIKWYEKTLNASLRSGDKHYKTDVYHEMSLI